MEPIKVCEHKILPVLGILSTLFSGTFFLLFSFLLLLGSLDHSNTTNIIILLSLALIALMGILLVWMYIRQKLIIYPEHITYIRAFGRSKLINYNDITYVTKDQTGQYLLYLRDREKPIAFELNTPGSLKSFSYITQRCGSEIKSVRRETNTVLKEHTDYIRSHWSKEQIEKEKRITLIIRVLLTVMVILSFIFLDSTARIASLTFTLLCIYVMYIWLYPKMNMEAGSKGASKCLITFPYILYCICTLVLLFSSFRLNLSADGYLNWLVQTACFTVILLIPYCFILVKRNIQKRRNKIATMLFILFFTVGIAVPTVNYMATVGEPEHQKVVVLDKSYHKGNRNRKTYYAHIDLNGEEKKMQISRSLYEEIHMFSRVTLCYRESILGMKYCLVHATDYEH